MSKNNRKKNQSAENLEVLLPDIEVTLAGRTFTMRELRFGEQLQNAHLLQPIAERFKTVSLESEPEETANKVIDILSLEHESVMQLMAICSRQSIQWIKSLTPFDGEELMLLWWTTNNRFFIRRLSRKAQTKAMMMAKQTETGAKSSQP